jgi:hypothetical protein
MSQACPRCGATCLDEDPFCEACGRELGVADDPADPDDAVADPSASPSSWEVEVTADREFFDRHRPAGVEFPDQPPRQVFTLIADTVQVGRTSVSRGIAPHVDLSGPPTDPGISHLHALLLRQDDGTYALCDLGSTNGTLVNDDPAPIASHALVFLEDGDEVHLGAWTTLTIRAH